MKSYSEGTIDRFSRSILDDEFDDNQQNEAIYDERVSGYETLRKLLDVDVKLTNCNVLNVGAGSGAPLGFSCPVELHHLEPNSSRSLSLNRNIVQGWCENIETDMKFDLIVCWGSICFVRSMPESLIQFNDHLPLGGLLVLDTVTFSGLHLCQTFHPDCFVGYAGLFGFNLHCRISFGHTTHLREGYRFVKTREFDSRYLRMPQATNSIRNFLFERDWSLA